MDPEQEFTYTMYCGDGGDGSAGDSAGEASTAGDDGEDGGYGGFDGTESANNEGFGSVDTGGGGDSGYDYEGAAYGTPDTITSIDNNVANQIDAITQQQEPDYFATGEPPANAVDPGIATDTIASYQNNLKAEIQSNPLGFAISPLGTAFKVGVQAVAANSMMNPSYSGVQSTTDGGGDSLSYSDIIPVAPYILGGTQAQPSQVLQYFSNQQAQPQTQGLLSRYEQAKQNVSGILGTNNQLGASNTSNFYYNYLNQKGLL